MLGCIREGMVHPWNLCCHQHRDGGQELFAGTEMSQPWDGAAGMLCGLVVIVLSGRGTPEVTVVWMCEPVSVAGVRSALLELRVGCSAEPKSLAW